MKTLTKILIMLACGITSNAMAFELQGSYSFTARESSCSSEKIDHLVLYVNADGEYRAAFSNAGVGLVYQTHALSWDGESSLSGSTIQTSSNAALFEATISSDQLEITGIVDSVVCEQPWTFTAQRIILADHSADLMPLATVATLDTFSRSFAVISRGIEGRLRMIRLPNGRYAANFGTPDLARILTFESQTLDTQAQTLSLFDFEDTELGVIWHLNYGTFEGKLAFQGYGLTTTGRTYLVEGLAQ